MRECACAATNLRALGEADVCKYHACVAQILQVMQSSVGTSAKCVATIIHYLTISWVAPARHKYAMR